MRVTEHPFMVVLVDEMAFLTAYHPDKNLRDRVQAVDLAYETGTVTPARRSPPGR